MCIVNDENMERPSTKLNRVRLMTLPCGQVQSWFSLTTEHEQHIVLQLLAPKTSVIEVTKFIVSKGKTQHRLSNELPQQS